MYKNIIFLIISLTVFTGCLNERGISAKYYNECREYYDARGYYHRDCDENLIEFAEVKEETIKAYEKAKDIIMHEEYKGPEHKVVW